MHVIEWERTSRDFSQHEVDDFYERPLEAPTLFRFTTTNMALPPHGGAFSLKLVLSGEEHYEIGPRRIILRPGQFLFVNDGETYASHINKRTESISIFVPQNEAAPAIADAVVGSANAIESCPEARKVFEIPQIAFGRGQQSTMALQSLIYAIDADDLIETQDAIRQLVTEALSELFNTAPPNAIADVKKRSTRDELRRRILRAKEQIDGMQGQYDSLDDLAASACLSKYHFLRSFNAIFGLSPAAYARHIRLERAGQTVAQTGDIITAARTAGYRDPHAFARAFKRVIGKPLPAVR